MTVDTDKSIELTDMALRTIQNMNLRCDVIGAWYGPDHPKTFEANNSLRRSLAQMIGLGGRISSDGPVGEDMLSLYGISFIHYGVIFHGDRNKDKHADTGEVLIGAPETGTWSVHS